MAIKKTKAKPKTKKAAPKPRAKKTVTDVAIDVDTYLLLDRSGSMAGKWAEVIPSINEYAAGVAGTKGNLLLAIFDGTSFDIIRDGPNSQWVNVRPGEVTPRGMTPLYASTIRIASIIKDRNPKRAVLAIMTDGDENQGGSKERANAALDELRAKDYQVVFLGQSFDNYAQAQSLGTRPSQTVSVSPGNYGATMSGLAAARATYGATGQAIGFSDKMKLRATRGSNMTNVMSSGSRQ